jgi:hypothetical protein
LYGNSLIAILQTRFQTWNEVRSVAHLQASINEDVEAMNEAVRASGKDAVWCEQRMKERLFQLEARRSFAFLTDQFLRS